MITPGFKQNRPQGRAARGFRPGLQQAGNIAHPHHDQPRRVEPQFRQAGRVQHPGFEIKEILPDQKDRPPFRGPAGQGKHDPARRRGMPGLRSMEFMQGPADQPALKGLVQRRKTKGDPGRLPGRIRRKGPVGEQRPGQPDASECEICRGIGHRGRHDSVPVMF